jgi:hypothetical protein
LDLARDEYCLDLARDEYCLDLSRDEYCLDLAGGEYHTVVQYRSWGEENCISDLAGDEDCSLDFAQGESRV